MEENAPASHAKRLMRPLVAGTALALIAGAACAGEAGVKVLDQSFRTGGAMFAYTEYELAGEPLSEGLGMDLDLLDPDQANQPDPFDFTAGIEDYEFSEEAMYAVNYQSQLGPHLVNGPVNAKAGGTMASLGKRFIALADAVGQPADELPQNFYPITFPLSHGNPELAGKPDVTEVGSESFDITTQDGTEKTIEAITPAYFRDYGSLAWKAAPADAAFTPVAAGGEMLKDAMWAQDFLGGMHQSSDDSEIDDVTSPDMDKDGTYKLGVSSADGVNGMFLTEIVWDRLLMLRDRFLFDGKTLGAKLGYDYDASSPVWIPAKVDVSFTQKNGANALDKTEVADSASTLRGTWTMLWPLSELYGMTDQREANGNKNNAFLAVFDGNPFPSAPAANRGLDAAKYVPSDDPFSQVALFSNMEFQNLVTLHFDPKAGTLVDSWKDGKRGTKVTAFDAAYAVVALGIYQRALDGLPVGYASASSGEPLGTEAGKTALKVIRAEGDFLMSKMIGKDGLVADSYEIGKGASDTQSLGTQFAAIRGLSAAFVSTGDIRYRDAARKIYDAVEAHMVDKASGLYNPNPGKPFEVDPWTQGAVMGALHELLQVVGNQDQENDPVLSRAHLTERYVTWFKTVGYGMQLAEWPNDSGEHMVKGDTTGDINGNGVKGLPFAGMAAVMASRVEVTPAK